MVTMYRSNLASALHVAIEERRKVEKQYGYTGDSGFVAGLVQILDAINRGEQVVIKND